MFEAVLSAEIWRKCVTAIGSLVEEVPLRITAEGIELRAMDPSHVSMIDFKMNKEVFAEFKTDKEVTIGIDIEDMSKFINRSRSDDILVLKLDEEKNKILMVLKGTSTRRFGCQLIDVTEQSNLKMPTLNTTSKIRLSSQVFREGLKDANIVSDHVTLRAEDAFYMSADGDTGDIEVKLEKGDPDLYEIIVSSGAASTFNLSYLTDMSKSIPGEMSIEIGNDMPVKIEFEIEGASFVYILAPRVER